LITVLAPGASSPALAIDLDTRVDGLEARLESLTRRVAAIETLLKEGGQASAPSAGAKGEPAWDFDDYTQASPFRVLQRSFDRTNGRVDLLLDVVEPIPDAETWAAASRDQAVPLHLIADIGDGATARPVPLKLERATRITPGARLHVTVQLNPQSAKLVRRIRIAHAPGSGPNATDTSQ
jgi:hypothetical protein